MWTFARGGWRNPLLRLPVGKRKLLTKVMPVENLVVGGGAEGMASDVWPPGMLSTSSLCVCTI